MEATGYNWVPEGAHACSGLIKRVYADHPDYAGALAAETLRQLAPQNPFLNFGTRQGFIAPDKGEPAAHACAITDTRLPGSGFIGYFEATGAGPAAAVLGAACDYLASLGVKNIFGPVNDTVWQRYGSAAGGEAPPYAGEPYTPQAYADYFRQAGFGPADRRLTTVISADAAPFARYTAKRDELLAAGYTFEELGPGDLARGAAGIHAIAAEVFAASPLFVPAGLDEFLYSARGQAGRAEGAALMLARDARGKPAAFLWGLPDGFSGGNNFIFKTVAVLPEYRGKGLGRALFCLMDARAKAGGAKNYIFSTMRSGNSGIEALAARGSSPYREYLTFRKALC